jgi:hypothetical protein
MLQTVSNYHPVTQIKAQNWVQDCPPNVFHQAYRSPVKVMLKLAAEASPISKIITSAFGEFRQMIIEGRRGEAVSGQW